MGGGGFKCRGRQSDAGVSSSDPDVLIPRCLVTLTGSDSLAKWPPLVALPVPVLPLRKEGCGLLSSGASLSLSCPQPDERNSIIDSRLVSPRPVFFLFFFFCLLHSSSLSLLSQHPLYFLLTSSLSSFVTFSPSVRDVSKHCGHRQTTPSPIPFNYTQGANKSFDL